MKSIAAILVEQRRPLVIDEVELPALSFGQVLVEVKCTRICGSQLGEIDGVKGPDRYLPHLLGHEAGGVVLDVGPEVSYVKPGDHVVLHWRPGLGIQAKPAQYQWRGGRVNAGWITTFQHHTVVSENRLTVVPKDLSFEAAALLADALMTGIGTVCREAALQVGESCLITGIGGIGMGAVIGAHLAGACPIVAVDVHDHKLSKAAMLGATHCINSRTEDLSVRLSELLPGGADLHIDGTGNAGVLEAVWPHVAPHGRTIMIGVMRHDEKFSFNTLPLNHGKRILGTEGGACVPHIDIPRYVKLIRSGRMDPGAMISHRCSLPEINEAIATMRRGESLHTLVVF